MVWNLDGDNFCIWHETWRVTKKCYIWYTTCWWPKILMETAVFLEYKKLPNTIKLMFIKIGWIQYFVFDHIFYIWYETWMVTIFAYGMKLGGWPKNVIYGVKLLCETKNDNRCYETWRMTILGVEAPLELAMVIEAVIKIIILDSIWVESKRMHICQISLHFPGSLQTLVNLILKKIFTKPSGSVLVFITKW